MVMTVFAGIAEFERDLIRERTGAGRVAAQQRGVRFGRPEKINDEQKLLAKRLLQEVMCHGDFAPYNVVLDGEQAIGIIDFDTCHPGPRSWDIAYALYRWSPFTNPDNKDGFGTIEDQILRARLFCQAYGLSDEQRIGLANLIIEMLEVLRVKNYHSARLDFLSLFLKGMFIYLGLPSLHEF